MTNVNAGDTVAASDSSPDPEALTETAQYLDQMHRERLALHDSIIDAEYRYLRAAWQEYIEGRITEEDLITCYDRLRGWGLYGFRNRWREVIPHSREGLCYMVSSRPLEDGTWRGDTGWPFPESAHIPPKGAFVVYVLLDGSLNPIYVGSTQHFRQRMSHHDMEGKQWAAWIAYQCNDRKHAFELETRFLQQYKPPLNTRRRAA